MRILKKLAALMLCLAMLLSLAACGRAAEPAASPEAPAPAESSASAEPEGSALSSEMFQPGMRFIPAPLSKPDGMGKAAALAIDGGTLYAAGENLSLFSAELDSLSWTELDLGDIEGSPLSMTVGSDKLYLLVARERTNYEDDCFFVIYDLAEDTAQVIEREPLPDGERPYSIFYVDGKLLVLPRYGSMHVYTAEGEYIGPCGPEGSFVGTVAVVGGKPYLTASDGTGPQMYALNLDTLEATPMFSVGDPYNTTCFSYVSAGPLLSVMDKGVSLLDAESGFTEPLFNWLDTGFSFLVWQPVGLTLTAAGEFIFVDHSNGEIYRLSQSDAPDNRKELTVAVGGGVGGSFFLRAIAVFNMTNPDYVAVQKIYSGEDADKIPAELATANDIDVLYLGSSTDMESAFRNVPLKSTLFEDLLPYLDADPELSREDFIPGVLEASMQGGHLYGITPSIMPYTVIAPESTAHDYSPWSMDTIMRLNSELPDGYGLFGSTPDFTLQYLLQYACGRFVDKDSASCSFDSEEFIQLLKLCAELKPYDYSTSNGCGLECGSMTLNMYYKTVFNSDFEYIGFPSADGGVNLFSGLVGPMSIMASSENKEAAWQFIRVFFTPQLQNNEICLFGIPVIESCLDDYLKRRMEQDETITQADVDKYKALVMSCQGFTEGGAVYDIALEEVNKYLGGGKTAEDAAKSIQSRVGIYLAEQFG